MYEQQALYAWPTDVLAKVILVADKESEGNSYSTLEEAVSSLLSKVRLGDPTHSELVDYLPEGVGEDADMPQLMVQIFN